MVLISLFLFPGLMLLFGAGTAWWHRIPGRHQPGNDPEPFPGRYPHTGLPGRARGRRLDRSAVLEAMAESVGHLAALLHSGGRAGHVWGELLRFHDSRARSSGPGSQHARAVLASAAHAAELGASPALAIRKELASWPVSADSAVRVARECWERVALAVRSSELSGCPLASLLSRLALDLEQSADAEAARQSALAGPRASVALLSWLPFLGGGLGLLLGVDPVDVLLGSPLGVPVLVLGLLFWVLGRFWSRRLVAGAEGIR